MSAILLICVILASLLVFCPACPNYSYCVPFTGENCCIKADYTEPDLPPIDNDCCGPHCRYTALNGPPPPPEQCDNTIVKGRCLLDTHCVDREKFIFANLTDCEFLQANIYRAADGLARYLAFDWDQATCATQNKKCGIHCCCRETCPTKFCNIVTSTTCP